MKKFIIFLIFIISILLCGCATRFNTNVVIDENGQVKIRENADVPLISILKGISPAYSLGSQSFSKNDLLFIVRYRFEFRISQSAFGGDIPVIKFAINLPGKITYNSGGKVKNNTCIWSPKPQDDSIIVKSRMVRWYLIVAGVLILILLIVKWVI